MNLIHRRWGPEFISLYPKQMTISIFTLLGLGWPGWTIEHVPVCPLELLLDL